MKHPIVYTFRRCPYAIRARMALTYAGQIYEVREVVLREKPQHMLSLSPKGTVPVLLNGGLILDESIDIVNWALSQSDPDGWLDWRTQTRREMSRLIDNCEQDFKPILDGYKYSDASEQHLAYRQEGLGFLHQLEGRLTANTTSGKNAFLFGDRLSYADVCVFPFVRQFAHVDKAWFDTIACPRLQVWLEHLLKSSLFLSIMTKYPQWREGDASTLSETSV